jgi:hypothetical protein
MSLQVFFAHQRHDDGATTTDLYSWSFYQGKPNEGVDPCDFSKNIGENLIASSGVLNDKNPGMLPNGEFHADVGGEACVYQGLGEGRPGQDVGWLHCPSRTVKCLKDYRFSENYTIECPVDGGATWFHAVAYCDW